MKLFTAVFVALISFSAHADVINWPEALSSASPLIPIDRVDSVGRSVDGKYIGDLSHHQAIFSANDGSQVYTSNGTLQELYFSTSDFMIGKIWAGSTQFHWINLNSWQSKMINTPFRVDYVNIDPMTSRVVVSSMDPVSNFAENLIDQSTQVFQPDGTLAFQVFSRPAGYSILGFAKGSPSLVGYDPKTGEILQLDASGTIVKRTALISANLSTLRGAWVSIEGEFVRFRCEDQIEGDQQFFYHVATGKVLKFLRGQESIYVAAENGVLVAEPEANALRLRFFDINGRETSSFLGYLDKWDPRYSVIGHSLIYQSASEEFSIADVRTGVIRSTKADAFIIRHLGGEDEVLGYKKLDEECIAVGNGVSSQIMKVVQ